MMALSNTIAKIAIALVEPHERGYHCRDEQQDYKHVFKLPEELPPGRYGFLGDQLIRAAPFQSRPDLVRTKAFSCISSKRGQDLVHRLPVCRYRMFFCGHGFDPLLCYALPRDASVAFRETPGASDGLLGTSQSGGVLMVVACIFNPID
jgi:hypothetical protein